MLRLKNGGLVAALVLMMAVIAGCPAPPQEQAVDPGASVAAPAIPAATLTTGETGAPATVAAGRPSAPVTTAPAVTTTTATAPAVPARLPRLVDLGSISCIPCQMMAPILEQLKAEYAGRVVVEVIDIAQDQVSAQRYGIRVIPTQIFFDANGNEIGRHEGYYPKEEIVKIFQQMGVR